MSFPLLQRISAWLCLALTLITGAVPAQGFVLCLEPDGCVSVERSTASEQCNECEAHAGEVTPATTSAEPGDREDCTCVDLPFSSLSQDLRIRPKPVEFQVGAWIGVPPIVLSRPFVTMPVATRAPPAEVPRPSAALVLIRSVVLLV